MAPCPGSPCPLPAPTQTRSHETCSQGGRDTTGKRRRVTAAHQAAQQLGCASPSLLCSSLGGSGEAVCLLPRRSAQAQSCLWPSLTLLNSCGREEGSGGGAERKKVAGKREGDRERERETTQPRCRGPWQGPLLRRQPLPWVAIDVTPQHHCGGGLDLSYAGRLLQNHTACLNPCGIKEYQHSWLSKPTEPRCWLVVTHR